jgi:hypothetical protein
LSELSAAPDHHEVRCTECGKPAVGPAFAWKAYLSGGYENDPVEVIVFCPGCALCELDITPSPSDLSSSRLSRGLELAEL